MSSRIRLVAAVQPGTNAYMGGYWFVNSQARPETHGFVPSDKLAEALPIIIPHLGREIDLEA